VESFGEHIFSMGKFGSLEIPCLALGAQHIYNQMACGRDQAILWVPAPFSKAIWSHAHVPPAEFYVLPLSCCLPPLNANYSRWIDS